MTPYEESVEACRELLHGWPFDRTQVRPALGPTIPLHCSDDFIAACRDLARDYEVGVQMHLAESKVQAVAGIERYGKTLAAAWRRPKPWLRTSRWLCFLPRW